jgi:hypothetical protein
MKINELKKIAFASLRFVLLAGHPRLGSQIGFNRHSALTAGTGLTSAQRARIPEKLPTQTAFALKIQSKPLNPQKP